MYPADIRFGCKMSVFHIEVTYTYCELTPTALVNTLVSAAAQEPYLDADTSATRLGPSQNGNSHDNAILVKCLFPFGVQ